jgi:hypothetical protein
MTITRFSKEHYGLLTSWWKQHGHPEMKFSVLPPTGILVNDGKPLVASFLYLWPGTSAAQIAWTTTNPDSGLKQRHLAVNKAVDTLLDIARSNGKTDIICFSSSSGLTKLISKKGLNPGSAHTLLAGYFEVK